MAAFGAQQGWLVVVDLQHVFGDPGTPWTTPRFDEIRPRIRRLVQAFGDRVVWTRFVAPADAHCYRLVEDPGAHGVRVVSDACAGSSDDDHDMALHLMDRYSPLARLVTADEVLAG